MALSVFLGKFNTSSAMCSVVMVVFVHMPIVIASPWAGRDFIYAVILLHLMNTLVYIYICSISFVSVS